MYGESVFTTMRMVNSSICDWEYHYDRLSKGIEYVYGPFIEGQDWHALLKDRLEERLASESGNKIIRLAIYRDAVRGLLKSSIISVHDLKLHLAINQYDPGMHQNKMKLRTCSAPPRPLWWPSFLKAGNYLETILAQKIYLKGDDDDLLFLSNRDTVLETSIANIFIVKHDNLFTAPLGPHVLDGIMRKKIIEIGGEYFKSVREEETSIEQLLKAEAVFGCNSIRGPFLIEKIDDHEMIYHQDFLDKFQKLSDRILK